jgi:hypothetical protein
LSAIPYSLFPIPYSLFPIEPVQQTPLGFSGRQVNKVDCLQHPHE